MQPFGRTMLVIGGARSGKSRHAQAAAEALPGPLVFIATAQCFDAEMADRIERHRADRGPRWRTVEAPVELAAAIAAHGDGVMLIDCLTLWATNLLLGEGVDARAHIDALLAEIARSPARLIFVTNEVGLGIVPDNALARRFRDLAGEINQQVAAAVDTVVMSVAGLQMRLKG